MSDVALDPRTGARDAAEGRSDPFARAARRLPLVVVRPPAADGRALERARARLAILGALFVLAFAVVAGRLAEATLFADGRETASRGSGGPGAAAAPVAARADLVDRNGVVLATSVPTHSLFADPALVIDPVRTARRLAEALPGLDAAELAGRLAGDRRFVWIRRNLAPRQAAEVIRLGLPGVDFVREERRIYPLGPLAAHAVGFTGVDGVGLMGVERRFDGELRGAAEPLRLSLDVRLQHVLREEIARQIATFSAIGGAGLIMDVRTGEVLAMVSLPDFDPNAPAGAEGEARFNRVTLGVYEMGSTFKVLNTALALESGRVRVHDVFDASRPVQVGRFRIDDFRGQNRPLTVAEILKHSSNIGSVRMVERVGPAAQREFMDRLGMLRESPVEIPEAGAPMSPRPWREINMMTIAFGHGIAVSPMHLGSAVSAVVNGGVLLPPTILARRDAAPVEGTRVVSPQTSETMRRLMRLVVASGSGAEVPGYLVGGKTGTAEKTTGRSYSTDARISSFIGAFPMHDPRYLVYLMVDEPKPTRETFGFATGGWVAAPAVGRIVRRIGPMLGVAPVDETRPEIREAVAIDAVPARAAPAAVAVPAAAAVPAAPRRH
jgi:cell division protein FtsI (penicillin-binding protein 3)